MAQFKPDDAGSLELVLQADQDAREVARDIIKTLVA